MVRLLLIEDDDRRVEVFKSWLPDNVKMVHAGSAGRALGILQRDADAYAGIMLDHDLQNQVVTKEDIGMSGSTVVSRVIEMIRRDVPILIHSMNPSDAPLMRKRLEAAGFSVSRMPMSELTEENFLDWLVEVRECWDDRG